MADRLRVALLLSTSHFEAFYGDGLGLSRRRYLEQYRNDWSWDWCRMLAGENVEATIYVATRTTGELVHTEDGYRVRFLPLSALTEPWVRFPWLERSPVGRYVSQLVNAADMLRTLRRGLLDDRVDVLCVQEYWTARLDLLVRALDTAVVAVDQGLPDRHEIKLIKRGSMRRTAAVVVQTEREAAKVARYGGAAQRIPNAVDGEFFTPDESVSVGSDPVILFVGRLHDAQKRISDVMRALARLPNQWRLEIAGAGPDHAMLERLSTELGVSDRVRYLGFVAESGALRDLYRRATVVALPSAYEGLPMVLLEAMSCATPVVGSDIPAIAEVVHDGRTGLLVPVGDPARLAEALAHAAARREELGRAARASILDDYDQPVVGPRLAQLLRGACSAVSVAA
ncbi:MAG: glycosyltransferase family 4 protein [Solirubrobacterales bacterium]|nr:glycosyltransferase family 4 protein [Solirubrobacterales bacterium]